MNTRGVNKRRTAFWLGWLGPRVMRTVYSVTRAPLLCAGVQRSASAVAVGAEASARSAGASGAAGGTEKRTGCEIHAPSTSSSSARTLHTYGEMAHTFGTFKKYIYRILEQ